VALVERAIKAHRDSGIHRFVDVPAAGCFLPAAFYLYFGTLMKTIGKTQFS